MKKRTWEMGSLCLLVLVVALGVLLFAHAEQIRNRQEAELARAMDQDDVPAVRRAFARVRSTRVQDPRGRTPLIWAASVGDVTTLREALRRGGDVSARTYNDETALMLAASRGHGTAVD